jgi:hypothetical protein
VTNFEYLSILRKKTMKKVDTKETKVSKRRRKKIGDQMNIKIRFYNTTSSSKNLLKMC